LLPGRIFPRGKTVATNTMLVDLFPTILDAVGATPDHSDADLPGRSLIGLANSADENRNVFSEYHAIFSPSGVFMVRNERFKYVHYVGYAPQLFDLVADPEERSDIAANPAYADVRASCEAVLKRICDPDEVDRAARDDQKRRIEAAGGTTTILSDGVRIPYTPTPDEFIR